jgi:hypothetical protein
MPPPLFGVFWGVPGGLRKKLPVTTAEIAGLALAVFHWFGWFIVNTRQIKRLATIALDADTGDTPAFALHGQIWLAILFCGSFSP